VDWDTYFLGIARVVSYKSKDPSTKTGAVLVRPDHTVVSVGYNGFPRPMPDNPAWLIDRSEKYKRIIHCEMNAMICAKEPLHGCTLYTFPFGSCERCFVHMVQAGIVRFVFPPLPIDKIDRWYTDMRRVVQLAKETGVELCEHAI
jgi:dCMP deaminase